MRFVTITWQDQVKPKTVKFRWRGTAVRHLGVGAGWRRDHLRTALGPEESAGHHEKSGRRKAT